MIPIDELHELSRSAASREDLSNFIGQLADSIETNPQPWENVTLVDFLRAWAAWLPVMDQSYINTGRPIPESLSWELIARMIMIGVTYE